MAQNIATIVSTFRAQVLNQEVMCNQWTVGTRQSGKESLAMSLMAVGGCGWYIGNSSLVCGSTHMVQMTGMNVVTDVNWVQENYVALVNSTVAIPPLVPVIPPPPPLSLMCAPMPPPHHHHYH